MFDIITEADYRKLIGKTAGRAFLFFGDEDYLKAHAVRATRDAICPDPAFAVFNDVTLDALDLTPDRLLDAMSPPPMMAEERLILLCGLDLTSMKGDDLTALIEALALLPEYDYNTVILQVAAGLIDEGRLPKKPGTVLKKLSEVATPVHFAAVGGARLAAWTAKHFQHLGVSADAPTCALLVSLVGTDMFLLSKEIEKIAYFVLEKGATAVTEPDVHFVAIPALTADAFALSNAILAGRSADALRALSVLKFQRVEPSVIMGELSRTLCDMQAVKLLLDAGKSLKDICTALAPMHEYKAKLMAKAVSGSDAARLARAVALCVDADAAVKRSYADYGPIEWLICSL